MKLLILASILIAVTCHPGPDRVVASAASVTVAVAARPFDLTAGDVDGDGAVDLLSVSEGGRVSVRLQRGGAWVPAPGPPLVIEPEVHLLALADLDGDRVLDLVATGHDTGAVWVGRGDGAGRFVAVAGAPFAAFTAARPHNHGLLVGDLDGDGAVDVIAADQEAKAIAVLLGDGRGGLRATPGSPIALPGEPYPPALGDVDADGSPDLVVPLVRGQAVAVLLGDGRGGFTPAPGSPHATVLARPYGVALADLDGDGHLDVVATHDDTDAVSVLLGDGRGELRAAPGSPVRLGRRIGRPAIADLDGDGHLDLVGTGDALIVAAGLVGGRFAPARATPLGESWRIITADLDGDGRADLVAPDATAGALRLWLSARRPAAAAPARPR